MDILIIENVSMGYSKYGIFDKKILTAFCILPTLHARQLAAITPKTNNVDFINERYSDINFEKKYDIVHINFTTSTAKRAYQIADIFRKKGIKIVLSGYHASALPNEAKKHADSVIIGRGENSWLNLLIDLEKNNLKPFYNPEKYDDSLIIPPTNIKLPGFVINSAIEATRGCPYKCEFCPEGNMPNGNAFFQRPVEEVVDEIRKLPHKTFNFYDNSLTIDPSYTKNLFKKMKGLNKKFSCNGNSNVLAKDTELIKLSKDAGCKSWLIGFESFSQKTIDNVGKKTNKVEEYKQSVNNIHANGMVVIGDFMFGFDDDTTDVFDKTLEMLEKLRIDAADFTILTPFPGTPLFQKLKKENRINTEDWTHYNMKTVVFKPKNMTEKQLLKGVQKMYREFYSYQHSMKRIIRSLKMGFYPFILVSSRNITASMNLRTFKTN